MKREIAWTIFLTIILAITSSALAGYPEKAINCIVNQPAGGTTDIAARSMTDLASKILGQPMVVMNKEGGTGSVGLAYLKKEKPDGYNICTVGGGTFIVQHQRQLPFDILKDFTPIMQFAEFPTPVLVKGDSPWKTFKELIEYAKKNPGKIRYGTSGSGSIFHLAMVTFASQEGIKWTHVPFKGGHNAILALLGGHVEVAVTPTNFDAFVRPGQLRFLSSFGQSRLPSFPEVPTWKELGYNIEMIHPGFWVGPKGMPKGVVDTLNGAFRQAVESAEFKKVMKGLEFPIIYRNPEELSRLMKELTEYYGKLVKASGLDKEE
jgi:tripartite-type tricarboxylate transporter receptor subunit TctC